MSSAIAHYRALHKIPELSGKEYKTAAYIENALREMGYAPARVGVTGVTAQLVSGDNLPWVILRADMDALAVGEETGSEFASEHPGCMHACGHDTHCAMLLGAAEVLRDKVLPQNILFLFQPAEENTFGALEMIAAGAMPENLAASFGFHVWPGVPCGIPVTRIGALMAASDVFEVHISGRSAHCAQRSKGNDALLTAVDIVSAFEKIEARAEDKDSLLFCGSIHSGTTHNIVPGTAMIRGTIRTYSPADRKTIKSALTRTVAEAAAAHGTNAEFIWESECPAVMNDAALVEELRSVLPELAEAQPTLAGEDFARYQELAPGVLVWLGTGDTPPLHNSRFFVPEELLEKGVEMWQRIAAHEWKK